VLHRASTVAPELFRKQARPRGAGASRPGRVIRWLPTQRSSEQYRAGSGSAIRLSAPKEIPVIYVYTHDSIGVGEDGPTHQPVEQIASPRAIPALITLRPANANATTMAWRLMRIECHLHRSGDRPTRLRAGSPRSASWLWRRT